MRIAVIITLILCFTATAYAGRVEDLQVELQTFQARRQQLINDFQGITQRYQEALTEVDREIWKTLGRIEENEEKDK